MDARERAGAAIEKATALGPQLPEVLYSQAFLGMIFDGSLDESERIFARVLDLDPNHGVARGWRAIALTAQGHWEAGLNEAREAARHHTFLSWYTHVLAAAGKVEEVESILKEVLAMYDPSQPRGIAGTIGGIYAGLGDADNAVSWMNKGLEEGYAARMHIPFSQYESIRGHPGFAQVGENVGLPALWADPTLGM